MLSVFLNQIYKLTRRINLKFCSRLSNIVSVFNYCIEYVLVDIIITNFFSEMSLCHNLLVT